MNPEAGYTQDYTFTNLVFNTSKSYTLEAFERAFAVVEYEQLPENFWDIPKMPNNTVNHVNTIIDTFTLYLHKTERTSTENSYLLARKNLYHIKDYLVPAKMYVQQMEAYYYTIRQSQDTRSLADIIKELATVCIHMNEPSEYLSKFVLSLYIWSEIFEGHIGC